MDTSRTEDILGTEAIELPADSYSLNWLNHIDLTKKHKKQLSKWEKEIAQFRKVSFASAIHQRHNLPSDFEYRLDHTIPEFVSLKKQPIVIDLWGFRDKRRTRSRNKKEPPSPFKNCQKLKSPSRDYENFGPETEKIIRIFEGDTKIYSECETSSVSDDETKSLRSIQRKKKDLATGLPEDKNYSIQQFIQGLDPEMTSTQQSQFETNESQVFYQDQSTRMELDVEDNSMYDSMSKASSKKKKKKKRAIVGF